MQNVCIVIVVTYKHFRRAPLGPYDDELVQIDYKQKLRGSDGLEEMGRQTEVAHVSFPRLVSKYMYMHRLHAILSAAEPQKT
jgi:hypothetical protein